MQRGRLSDRGVHDPLLHQPLHLMQERLPPRAIAFHRLLLEELVDVAMAAIGVDARADPIGLNARGGVAKRPPPR
jgi:hypothetical protein